MEDDEVKLCIVDSDEQESETPSDVQPEHQRPVDDAPVSENQDSQSSMSFANDRMKQIIGDETFCG